jgi:hypothetical protein
MPRIVTNAEAAELERQSKVSAAIHASWGARPRTGLRTNNVVRTMLAPMANSDPAVNAMRPIGLVASLNAEAGERLNAARARAEAASKRPVQMQRNEDADWNPSLVAHIQGKGK